MKKGNQENQKTLSTEAALEFYAQVLNSGTVRPLKKRMARDFRYESQMVLTPIMGGAKVYSIYEKKVENYPEKRRDRIC